MGSKVTSAAQAALGSEQCASPMPVASGSGAVVGYARVSSEDQNLARQLEGLGTVDKLFTEKISGKNTDRPQLQAMLSYVREGDVVRVKSPDRLSRSTADLLNLVSDLGKRGVGVEFVDNSELSTATPHGRFTLTILAAVAELERDMIRARQREGIALAKDQGVYKGRKPALTPEQIEEAGQLVASGVPKTKVAEKFGVNRRTIIRALQAAGA